MPGIDLTLSGTPDPAQARHIAKTLTALTCRELDKEEQRTMVQIRYLPREQWFIAGRSLAELDRDSFRLVVTVTDETNTKQQKADYQDRAFQELSRLLGDVHPHSNIHIVDCRAAAYGYGGISQEAYSYRG